LIQKHRRPPALSMPMMMHMTFYWGPEAMILFSGWMTENYWQLFGSALFFFLLGMLYEFTASLRIRLAKRADTTPKQAAEEPLLGVSDISKMTSNTRSIHFQLTVLHFFQMTISYSIMLACMSFNAAIFLASIFGFTVGFFIWGHDRYSQSASCH